MTTLLSRMTLRVLRLSAVGIMLFCLSLGLQAEVTWFPLGPFGGDARSFATDPRNPKHIYLGTTTGWVYDSHDGGASWKRVAQIAHRNDLIIDHILPDANDPQRLLVAAWKVDSPDGGLWISDDGGVNWYAQAEMHGQSIRAIARSQSNPNELVAGTLRGVYRSLDGGAHWKQISPKDSTEIHEVESIAIDPVNPDIIYAGTWHLPWKTVDGGVHWTNIKQGLIDDSDVFSIIVDPADPKVVYASACSGIYKSVDAAAKFTKIQGIPSTARRTRKLAQDPKHLDTIFAGTTEGLYRTLDAGAHWNLLTSPDLIVNDVYIDPANPDHVLLATDRGGVLSSNNAGESFEASNAGFSSRQITAYAADPHNPARLYVGVVNGKQAGGVFASNDAGVSWQQDSSGLGGRDIFSLAATEDGVILAGTNHGIFRLQDGEWVDAGVTVLARHAGTVSTAVKGKTRERRVSRSATRQPVEHLDELVYSLNPEVNDIYAGTSSGLLHADAFGNNWSRVPSLKLDEVRYLAVQGRTLVAASLKEMEISSNAGEAWKPVPLPGALTQVSALALDDDHTVWVGGREGLFRSSDMGATWQQTRDMALNDVDSIYFDRSGDRILVTTAQSSFVFSVHVPDHKVHYWNSGWKLRFARPVGDHLVAATLFDGIVIQPKMVDSAVVPTRTNGAAATVATTAGASATATASPVKR
ncbi:hypothetical protein [Granulicella sp. 5B5]|uniref:hypothetical protein n=1 Tax=Granulicella sp. 5B5 TaxID=1617967 RepID=UPI0015F479E1|nr:hypothetical protein [Granulicella sp. 5B5]